MKRPLDIASSGHRAQNQLAMNDPPPVLIDLHSASSRRESQNAFRRRKKGTVATRPHSSALGRTSGPVTACLIVAGRSARNFKKRCRVHWPRHPAIHTHPLSASPFLAPAQETSAKPTRVAFS